MMSMKLIQDVFSHPEHSCEYKIRYMDCYLGKLETFIYRSSMSGKERGPLNEEQKK